MHSNAASNAAAKRILNQDSNHSGDKGGSSVSDVFAKYTDQQQKQAQDSREAATSASLKRASGGGTAAAAGNRRPAGQPA